MEKLNVQQDHWIKDINNDILINLKGCVAIYLYHFVYSDGTESNYVKFFWSGKTYKEINFSDEKTMRNFYEHIKNIVKVNVIDSSRPPLKIDDI